MATFTYLNPISANLKTTTLNFSSGVTPLTCSRNNGAFIYTNYPEQIGLNNKGLALADNGYYLNKQTISAGEAMIAFSHWNRTGHTLKYRIRIYNPTTSTSTVTRSNIGYATGWDSVTTVENYYTTSNTTYTLAASTWTWLTNEYSISSGQPFNGMIKISTTTQLSIAVYAYYNASTIDSGTKTAFPYDPNSTSYSDDSEVYSGLGAGFFLTIPHGTINVSSLPYKYVTNKIKRNSNEITPINLVGTSLQANENQTDASELNNLGNWFTQNYHTMTLYNDTSSSKTVYGYVGSNAIGNTPVMAKGSNINSYRLETTYHLWKWCSVTLAPYESHLFDWPHILATYGAAATCHVWSLTDPTS